MHTRRQDLLIILLFLPCICALWFWPSLREGKVLCAEDIVMYFYPWRAALYNLAHGDAFSLWNPVPGLGVPRFSNIQAGYFSPCSLLFYAVPTDRAMSLYPWIIISLLSLFTYGLFRTKGIDPLPSVFGALSWVYAGMVLESVQHLPIIETLLWLMGSLFCWERFSTSRDTKWAACASFCLLFMIVAGSPQILLYSLLVLAGWILSGIYSVRKSPMTLRRSLMGALMLIVAAFFMASIQVLPVFELMLNSQRSLLAQGTFSDMYRAAPHEMLLLLAKEAYLFIEPPPLIHGPFYKSIPGVSIITVFFALMTLLRRPRPWVLLIASLFFLLGTLGTTFRATEIIQGVLPALRMLRAPLRMIIPAAFLISWLSAMGMQQWLQNKGKWRMAGGFLCIVWIMSLAWAVQHGKMLFIAADSLMVPDIFKKAAPRLAVEFSCPPTTVNVGIRENVPTVTVYETLLPRPFFEALFASQLGPLSESEILDKVISRGTMIPLRRPTLPLMRAFNVKSLIGYEGGRYVITCLPPVPGKFFLATSLLVVRNPEERWALAASEKWNPEKEAIVSSRPEAMTGAESMGSTPNKEPVEIDILADGPDKQAVSVKSTKGGLLVASALMYPGWKVTVDGRQAQPVEADLALRAVAVPPGSHIVEWVYRPWWLLPSLMLVTAGLLMVAFLAFIAPLHFRQGEKTGGRADPTGQAVQG